ncbi:TPA: hypothetical protein EYO57_11410 [Candidatus Poribacteria bacterium]|nr:hypothetical protein [Candidatus Poribacteria bacterium]
MNLQNMSFFKSCPLPADLCGLILDFVYTVDQDSYKRCVYEAQHHVWYATELCGVWCADMKPHSYTALVKQRTAHEDLTRPMGYYQRAPYWDLF